MKHKIYRQGDVLIVRVASIPADASPAKRDDGRIILAYGEITGHSHAIEDTAAKGWLSGETLYLDLEKKTKVWHEDHNPKQEDKPMILPAGQYIVLNQVEYRRREIVRVID